MNLLYKDHGYKKKSHISFATLQGTYVHLAHPLCDEGHLLESEDRLLLLLYRHSAAAANIYGQAGKELRIILFVC